MENLFSRTHLGVWVLVCGGGGIGHMAHEIAHFSCCVVQLGMATSCV